MADYQRRKISTNDNAFTTTQIIAVVTLLPAGAFLLLISCVSLAASLLGTAMSAPLFLLFSPVILPAIAVIALAVAGFLTSGAFAVTGLSALTWLVNYGRRLRRRPPEPVESAKQRVLEGAGYLGQKAKEAGEVVQSKAQAQEGRKT